MEKLKSINWKEWFLNNGEKAILGVVLVFVLGSVCTSRWRTYERTPENFVNQINSGKTTFVASRWPEERQSEFEARDPGDEVARLLDGTPQGLSLFQYSTRWVWPIRKRKAKLREPELLPPDQLVADAATMLIQMQPETQAASQFDVELASADEVGAVNDPAPGLPPGTPSIQKPRIEAPRGGQVRAAGAIPAAGQIPGISGGGANSYDAQMAAMGGKTAGGPANPPGTGPIGVLPPPGGLPGTFPGQEGQPGMGAPGMGVQQGPVGEARGMRFVSLRGVIPMKLIVAKFGQALNLDTPQEAYQQVQFWDFELERQTAEPGGNAWKGAWETVVIEDTIKLLDRLEFDIDIVGEQYRDPVFTMPLPYRVTGSWDQAIGRNGLIASHPQIKKILTKQEQLQAEARSLATLKVAELDKQIKQERKAGFSFVQHDTSGMQAQMAGNQESMSLYNQALQEVMEEEGLEGMAPPTGGSNAYPGMQPGYQGRQGGAFATRQVVTIPESLLFRFLDFSVVPGNAYRYRLRLKMQNPNFDRDPAELLDVSSREGKFRITPWSQPSTPAVVQEETHLFVRKVGRRGVSMDAYQWLTDTGTYVNGMFEELDRAERVAAWQTEKKMRKETVMEGGVLTDVLRPANQTFMEERIDYVTPHTLIDYEQTTVINPDEFPDLELSPKRVSVTLDEVVTIDRFGELKHLDSDAQVQSYQGWQNLMAQQKQMWGHLRRTAQPVGGIASLLGGAGEETDDQPTTRGRRRNSTKRRIGQQGYNPYGGGNAYGGATTQGGPGAPPGG